MKYLKYVLSFFVYIVLTLSVVLTVLVINMDNISQLFNGINVDLFNYVSTANILIVILVLIILLGILMYILIQKKQEQLLYISLISTSIIITILALFVNNLELVNNFNLLTQEFSTLFISTIKNMIYQCIYISFPIFVIGVTMLSIKIYKIHKKY